MEQAIMEHKIIERRLSNGISLVMIPLEGTAAVTTIVLVGVGSRYEDDHRQGLAHFTEHMVFKGGRKYRSSLAISQSLDAVGGEFNAFTSQELTGYYTKTAAQHLELGLDILSDMVLHATFPQEELEKEKGVIVEEINMYEDMPMRKVDQVLSFLTFGDTPLGRAILGTKKSVTSYKREDFVKYRHDFYKGSQCTIAIAGAVDPEKTTKLVESYFQAMDKGAAYQPATGVVVLPEKRVRIEEKKSEQTHLMLAVKAYPLEHPKRYAYRVLSTVLGGNMSSRLFVSVREKQGLCYYVRAHPDYYSDVGLLIASAGVDNSRLLKAVEAILIEFAKLRDKAVDLKELNRAKQFLVGKTMLAMEDSEQVAELYGMQSLLERKLTSVEEIEKAVLAVTAAEIQDVAAELFTDENLRLAIIGPHSNPDPFEKALTFSP